jgi:hypothetical protein
VEVSLDATPGTDSQLKRATCWFHYDTLKNSTDAFEIRVWVINVPLCAVVFTCYVTDEGDLQPSFRAVLNTLYFLCDKW